jgi:hypothetical protein
MADGLKDAEVVYAGEASFDGAGRVTIGLEEFNRFVAMEAEHVRWKHGLDAMAGAKHQTAILATWPFALSHAQIEVASLIIDGCMVVAENLLAGRRWDEKKKP